MICDSPDRFKVLGIQQIAIGGADKSGCGSSGSTCSAWRSPGTFSSERENVDEDICAIGSGPFKVEVDLMQPLDPDKKPAVHVTPLNHVGLWIDDLPAAVEWLTAQGVRFAPGGIRQGAAGFDICFMHPKGNDEFPIARRGRADRAGAGAARGGERVRDAGGGLTSPGSGARPAPDRQRRRQQPHARSATAIDARRLRCESQRTACVPAVA